MNRLFALLQATLFLTLLAYCGKAQEEGEQSKAGKGPDNRPPVIKSAKIQPAFPTVKSDLGVIVQKSIDPDGNPIEYVFQWLINGEEVQNGTDDILSKDMLQKGQEIQCVIIPTDGEVEGEPFITKPVMVANSLPVIDKIEIKPEMLVPGEKAELHVQAHDLDDDPISILCEWFLNDQSVLEGEMSLSLADTKKKDRLYVRVSVEDEEGQGQSIQSKILTLQNRPPQIRSEPPAKWNTGDVFRYRVEAMDPDGDPVQVRVEGKMPSGMVWDRDSLILTWKPRENAIGPFKLQVIAEDNDGGVCKQEFTLTLS
jgi:hypothetical protein